LEDSENSEHSANSHDDTFAIEDESVLLEMDCQKEFFIFFKKTYKLIITDFRVVIMYYGYNLEKGIDTSRNVKR